MPFESYEEIIQYAIKREKEAAEFYEEASKKESFSGAKEMLVRFAEEERRHQTILEDLDSHKDKIKGYKFEWIPDMKRSNYMVDMTYEEGMDYPDLLRLAMKREEKALALYNELLANTEDPDHIQLFKMLCQEEAKHKQYLETLYDDFMAAQGD
jgi:rubrerythrin